MPPRSHCAFGFAVEKIICSVSFQKLFTVRGAAHARCVAERIQRQDTTRTGVYIPHLPTYDSLGDMVITTEKEPRAWNFAFEGPVAIVFSGVLWWRAVVTKNPGHTYIHTYPENLAFGAPVATAFSGVL